MATNVVINGQTFAIPNQGEPAPWGEDLSSAIVEIADVLSSINGSADLPLTSFTIANNTAVAANVVGASFDTSTVRSFVMEYSIYRSTSLSEFSEVGTLYGTYLSTGNSWELAQTYAGSSSVVFSITTGGQIQYTSSNMSGTGYVGKMKFSAKSFLQA